VPGWESNPPPTAYESQVRHHAFPILAVGGLRGEALKKERKEKIYLQCSLDEDQEVVASKTGSHYALFGPMVDTSANILIKKFYFSAQAGYSHSLLDVACRKTKE